MIDAWSWDLSFLSAQQTWTCFTFSLSLIWFFGASLALRIGPQSTDLKLHQCAREPFAAFMLTVVTARGPGRVKHAAPCASPYRMGFVRTKVPRSIMELYVWHMAGIQDPFSLKSKVKLPAKSWRLPAVAAASKASLWFSCMGANLEHRSCHGVRSRCWDSWGSGFESSGIASVLWCTML